MIAIRKQFLNEFTFFFFFFSWNSFLFLNFCYFYNKFNTSRIRSSIWLQSKVEYFDHLKFEIEMLSIENIATSAPNSFWNWISWKLALEMRQSILFCCQIVFGTVRKIYFWHLQVDKIYFPPASIWLAIWFLWTDNRGYLPAIFLWHFEYKYFWTAFRISCERKRDCSGLHFLRSNIHISRHFFFFLWSPFWNDQRIANT